MTRRYLTPSSISAGFCSSSSRHCRGAISVTSIISTPATKHTLSAIAITFLIAAVSRRPQYCAVNTSMPSPAPLTTICSRNCI